MRRVSIAVLLTASILVSAAAPAAAATVIVDCAAGASLQAAINIGDSETPLEVHGVCNESIVVDRPITILGGDPTAAIDASGTGNTAITIQSDAVFIRNLTIRGGERPSGGPESAGHGVYAGGPMSFSLLGVTIEDNQESGVFMIDSYLTIARSRVRHNGFRGIMLIGGCCGIIGADSIVVRGNGDTGISTDGDQTLVLTNSRILYNGSGVFTTEDGYVADSLIRYNAGGGVGGYGTGRIVRSRVVDNGGWGVSYYQEVVDTIVARNGAGGVEEASIVTGSVVRRNGGPGITCSSCAIDRSRIRFNEGPGVAITDGTITDSTITHNTGSGAVTAGDVAIAGSLISRNTGTGAGALSVAAGRVDLVNSTVRKNVASNGAAFAVAGTLSVANTTVFRNYGTAGVFTGSGDTTVAHSIVHDHRRAADHCTGNPITSGGYNVVTAPGCAWAATDTTADPLLAVFAYNGGPTATHALLPGSPAIDAIPAATCAVAHDQRGEPRPVGPGCDSGAFEVQ